MLRITGIVLACLFFMSPATARQYASMCVETGTVMRPSCMGQIVQAAPKVASAVVKRVKHVRRDKRAHRIQEASNYEVPTPSVRQTVHHIVDTIVAHPAGCPSRAFCGCGASIRVFGHSVRELWLAANWFKFPRSAPVPGTVAVRRHHVMVLEADLGGGIWRVYDANSGGHATRVHARSIAGYTIVSPRA